jgi:hypothetical protein
LSSTDITGGYRVVPCFANSAWTFKEGHSVRWLQTAAHVQPSESLGAKFCRDSTEAPARQLFIRD